MTPCAPSHPLRSSLDLGARLAAGAGGSGAPALGGGLGTPFSGFGGGVSGIASTATTGLLFSAIGSWVSGGATFVLHQTAHVIAETTAPRLDSTWFSAAYWRVAAISAVLTLPFLFAASVQALIRSDVTLLIRAALGYLPLAMLAVAIAAPVTMLLLSASDELAAAVSSAAGHQGVSFLDQSVGPLGALGGISGSPFLAFLIGLFTVAGALVLWIELLIREAAVYVIVLMLPLAFAALVWPARRIWAIRSVELLLALILSKFAIVAVLSLGGAALDHTANAGLTALLSGLVLLILAAFAPWAMLRLLPLAELATSTAGVLRGHSGLSLTALRHADDWASLAHRWASTTGQMRRSANETERTGPLRPSAAAEPAARTSQPEPASPPAPAEPDEAATVPGPPGQEPEPPFEASMAGWETLPPIDIEAGVPVAPSAERS